ncbi:MAG TPA: tRNA pseudouridine(38-40) synthase TruA [Candidatus Dormibacteraeota bacterium]|nr:tRNA pseudouridine(38-40) synthase TruA [Candidatus Dormibacteraeota bacterium]
MRNIKLVVEYEGTRYHGWQEQAGKATVEGELKSAIVGLSGERPELTAAGRTDAGVHALGQCVNFILEGGFPVEQLAMALNSRLPADIAVRHAEVVDPGFNARYSALLRRYAYRIRQSLPRGAYQRQYAWGLRETLDIARMQAAGEKLIGRHDFRVFGRSPRPGGHTVRNVSELEVRAHGEWVTIAVAADAFLYGMVRRIAGALVEVGRQRRSPGWIEELLNGSTTGLRPAPAQGLVQVAVEY